jgi:hypothetical protein
MKWFDRWFEKKSRQAWDNAGKCSPVYTDYEYVHRTTALNDWAGNSKSVYTSEPFFRITYHQQENLREKHPGLKELWDQYLVMLHLCNEQNK